MNNYKNRENERRRLKQALEKIDDFDHGQLKSLIKELYLDASADTKNRVGRQISKIDRRNTLLSMENSERLFQSQAEADLKEWESLNGTELSVFSAFNEDFNGWISPFDDKKFAAEMERLGNQLLRLLWDAEDAAGYGDWPLTIRLLKAVNGNTMKIRSEYFGDENVADILQDYYWKENVTEESIRSVFETLILDQSLNPEKKTSRILELWRFSKMAPDFLAVRFRNPSVSYPFEFLDLWLKSVLMDEDISDDEKFRIFKDTLSCCDLQTDRDVLVTKYGDSVPEIYYDFYFMSRLNMAYLQQVKFLEAVIPKITDPKHKQKLKQSLALAQNILKKRTEG